MEIENTYLLNWLFQHFSQPFAILLPKTDSTQMTVIVEDFCIAFSPIGTWPSVTFGAHCKKVPYLNVFIGPNRESNSILQPEF